MKDKVEPKPIRVNGHVCHDEDDVDAALEGGPRAESTFRHREGRDEALEFGGVELPW